MGKTIFQKVIRAGSILLVIAFLYLSWTLFDISTLIDHMNLVLLNYEWLIIMTVCYFGAFLLRGFAWQMYGKANTSLRIYLYALFYSLFFNHVFPVKVGDLFRIGVLAKEKGESWDTAMHSVIIMRLLDLLCLCVFSTIGALYLSVSLNYSFILLLTIILLVGIGVLFLYLIKVKPPFFDKHKTLFKEALFHKRAVIIIGLVAISWGLEGVVVYGVIQSLHFETSFLRIVWVNSVTVASQVFQFAPGGLLTYESTMSFALAQVGMSWKDAYHIAIITHAYKFLFSFLVGGITYLLHPISAQHIKVWRRQKGESS
jgi:uncharacterized membrane protein YbhN (UPF0104 family)